MRKGENNKCPEREVIKLKTIANYQLKQLRWSEVQGSRWEVSVWGWWGAGITPGSAGRGVTGGRVKYGEAEQGWRGE